MQTESTQRSSDGDKTRAAILKAAEDLFVEQGFAATSMATVAKRANITKSLIHHHFGSKRELWDAVKDSVMQEYGQAQQQLLESPNPGLHLLEESIIVYFRFLQRNPHVVRLWNWMQVEDDKHCADLSHALIRAGVEVLSAGQRAGDIRSDVEPENILAMFFSLVRGWFVERPIMASCSVLKQPEQACDECYLRTIVKVFIDGLRPRP